MRVLNFIKIYEIKDEKVDKELIIKSHWNMNDRVILEFDNMKLTVLAADLERAIRNATNHR